MLVYRADSSLVVVPRDGRFDILDAHGKRLATVNNAALAVLSVCRMPASVDVIVAWVEQHLGADREHDIAALVTACLGELLNRRLVSATELNRGAPPANPAAFIERQARFRLGDCSGRRLALPERVPDNVCRMTGTNGAWSYHGRQHGRMRSLEKYFALLTLPDSPIVIDLDFTSPGALPPAASALFTQSRPVDQRNAILWPLAPYHQLDAEPYGATIAGSDRPWRDKIERAIWRGRDTGYRPGKHDLEQVERAWLGPTRVHPRRSERRKANRFQLVQRLRGHPDLDVGFTLFRNTQPAVARVLQARGFCRAHLSFRELLRYKYLLVVEGNDVASQLTWALASHSVVLMPPPTWENLVHAGLRPWRHYVPVAADFSDLPDAVQWCRRHDGTCRRIAAAATRHMQRLYDPLLEQSIQQRVLDVYLEHTGQAGASAAGAGRAR